MQNDYPQSAVALFIVVAVFTMLPTISVALRLAGRRIKRVALWYDDYMIMASLSYVECPVKQIFMLNLLGVTNGDIGRPSRTASNQELAFLAKTILALQLLWVTEITLIKLGILLFYLRIFSLRRDRIVAQAMIGATACWWLACLLGWSLVCQPFNKKQVDNCSAGLIFWRTVAVAHIFVEIIILLLPLPMVWGLQLPLRKKLGLSVLFALGIFVCITSAIRVYMMRNADQGDFSEKLPVLHMWSFLEPTIAICTSCLPMARPVFAKYKPIFLSRSNASKLSERELIQNRA